MDNSIMLGMLKLEVSIVCPVKHGSMIDGDKLVLMFKSQKSSNKAYDIIRMRYDNKRMWNYTWNVKQSGLSICLSKS